MANDNTVTMEGVDILFRNFEGRKDKFNESGDREFSVVLNEDVARAMLEDGWNVKQLSARNDAEEGADPPPWILKVAVSYKNRPPKIAMITESNRVFLNEDNVELLDWADIRNVDVIVSPYHWEVGSKSGIKAYLKTGFFTIEEDYLEKKYASKANNDEDVPF